MEFKEKLTIYLQIVDYVEDHILEEAWKQEERLPSVRELAVELQVNPNTVMRAYDQLQQRGIIQNRRGVGNFISTDAVSRILQTRRERFMGQELPGIFRRLELMNIGIDEMLEKYQQYSQEIKSLKKSTGHENK